MLQPGIVKPPAHGRETGGGKDGNTPPSFPPRHRYNPHPGAGLPPGNRATPRPYLLHGLAYPPGALHLHHYLIGRGY